MICNDKYHKNLFTKHLEKSHNLSKPEYYLQFIDKDGDKCLCGCGNTVVWRRQEGRFYDFLHGHNIKNRTKDDHPALAKRSELMSTKVENGTYKRPDMFMTFEQRKLAQSKATVTKILRDVDRNSWGIRTSYISRFGNTHRCSSLIERRRMIELDNDETVSYWTRSVDIIPYYDSEKQRFRSYNPDLLITYLNGNQVVEEIKGQVTQNTFDKAIVAMDWYRSLNISYRILKWRDDAFNEVLV